MIEHKLIDGTLKVERDQSGATIVAKCVCGWSSAHFTLFAASAAFRNHQEQCASAPAQR